MKTISTTLYNAIRANGRQISARIVGSATYGKSDINSINLYWDGDLCKSLMKVAEVELDGFVSETSFTIEIGVRKGDGAYEYVDYGTFYVYETEQNVETNSTKFVCYDQMYEAMEKYSPVDITYPCTVAQYFDAICEALGWEYGTLPNTNKTKQVTEEKFDATYTYRDILDQFAEVFACMFEFRDGTLEAIRPYTTNKTVDKDVLTSLTIKQEWTINAVVLSRQPQNDDVIKRDETATEWHEFKIVNNQIMDKDRASFIDAIFNVLNGYTYYDYEYNSYGLLQFELGDVIKLKDLNDVERLILLLHNNIEVTQGLKETSIGAIPSSSDEQWQYTTADQRFAQKTQLQVDKQEQTITAVVETQTEQGERMTEIEQDVDGITTRVTQVETDLEETLIATEVQYALGDNQTTPPPQTSTAWSADTPVWTEGKYIWQRTKLTKEDGTIMYSTPACIQGARGADGEAGEKGEKGDDGRGITSIDYRYKATTTQTAPNPSDITSTTIPTLSSTNKYLWQKETITYTDGAGTPTVLLIAVYGDTGASGTSVSISSTSIKYAKSASQTSHSGLNFTTTIPTLDVDNPYLWTETTVNYSTGVSTTTYSVSSTIQGVSVGASNLLPVCFFEMGGMSSGNKTTYAYRINSANNPIEVAPSTNYILNINDFGEFTGLRVGIHSCASNGTFINDSGWINLKNNVPYMFKTRNDTYKLKFVFSGSTTSETVTDTTEDKTSYDDVQNWLRNVKFKFEQGNIPTNWSPANEDLDNSISEANTNATNAQSTASNALQQATDLAEDINTLDDDINGATGIKAQIETTREIVTETQNTANGIQTRVSTIEQSIITQGEQVQTIDSTLAEYFEFSEDGLTIRKEVGGQSTGFKATLNEEALLFKKGEDVVASAGGSSFDMVNAKVNNTQSFMRDDVDGAWDITLKHNGDLTFKWKG